ncbi:MAG: valine--tRNA ligase [Candidatus Magasanikbacteria bacterium]|nr:valine--tRNA ligase [Candidatus Magasanikbacteria bacterium]
MPARELPKAYEPYTYEDNIYKRWEKGGFFAPESTPEWVKDDAKRESFSMVLPPPNVTGTLHMGHAVMLAVQDVMARYHRMKGDRTLWIPGTDHAAVATESKVEKMLIEGGMKKPKTELGREKFLEHVEKFASESHDTIVNQAKKMGASLDWSREAFTLDKSRNTAVNTLFKMMYDDGLIYRGYRVVNWSVKGQSTCSDDELVHVERPGKLYYFTYGPECPITIATTRPETKLGDTAIAVHPKGRWKKYIGETFVIKNFGQTGHELSLKVFGDESIDDAFGTGALGVTTAHSPVDFEMYRKQKELGNDIGLIQVIGEDGNMTDNAGKEYAGLTIEEARKKVVAWLEKSGLLEKAEDTMQNVGTSDRFGDVVEPLPKTQWFIEVNKEFTLKNSKLKKFKAGDTTTLKKLMQSVVKTGEIEIIPDRFNKTYFHWIDNLRDWNISRQIWYGHQIPVWYKGDEITVGTKPEGSEWTQDPDTLDTWFSSGSWTFSTLGWPKETDDLKKFHPTSVLETGYDILFFWVARMILMSTYALGEVPFKTVYLHGLVRDEEGRKMSKSLGNIIDPLDMIQKYGTDATRLSLLIGGTPGNDMRLSEEKIAGFRNFTNKLWNISRFMLLNIQEPVKDIKKPKAQTAADEWILWKLNEVVLKMNESFGSYQFSIAGETLRDFTWNELADWYLEIAKVEGEKSKILNYILNTILKLWHPFMPFVTEQVWQEIYGGPSLMMEEYPKAEKGKKETGNIVFIDITLRNVITKIRSIRTEYKIEPAKKIAVSMRTKDVTSMLTEYIPVFTRLAGLETITHEKIEKAVSFTESGIEVDIDLSSAIDTTKEKARIEKEIASVEPYVKQLEKKLSNKEFVQNAPKVVVEKEQQKLEEGRQKLQALQSQLKSIKL